MLDRGYKTTQTFSPKTLLILQKEANVQIERMITNAGRKKKLDEFDTCPLLRKDDQFGNSQRSLKTSLDTAIKVSSQ